MQTVKDAANYVSESVQQATSTASKEGNKEIAKGNTDASLGTRAEAAKDAVGDKIDESKHDSKAELHKQKAQN
ncbi:glucose-repressible protein [Acaromyces ingoldii]|uniref:Glucose-repressible protein n=1 Tax=Acaromyces ingoldii TaxID=215250 RepID=A0A316YEW4_9BASI|nr:glucose-repressible protein [Acaromyces ingoldii]PWN86593.1 glucose-repressible protein [Acaromyces ingoldii]